MNASLSVTSEHWLNERTTKLEKAGIGTSRLDCLILLEEVLGKDRTHLLAHPETEITYEQLNRLEKMIEKRLKHVPVAQILGRTEFFGREFIINKHVLEPRPESETIIELLLNLKLPNGVKIADIGTGSGALGITAALELPNAHMDLFELDDKALKVATMNTKKHKLNLKVIKSDLLLAATGSYDVILANLPYVPDSYEINEAAANEPRIAIFGGKDGLDLYRRLFGQLKDTGYVFTESLPFQHQEMENIANKKRYRLIKEVDFIQLFALGS